MADGKEYRYYIRGSFPAATPSSEAPGESADNPSDVQSTGEITPDVIQRVQEALNAAGYDCGTPDGVAGQKTTAAVNAYQAAKGLNVTGEIDAVLLESLGIWTQSSSDLPIYYY